MHRMRTIILAAFDDLQLVARYVTVGLFAVALDLGLLFVLTEFAGLWYVFSAVVAFAVTFVVAFLLQKHWTFKDGSGAYVRQGTSYLLIGLANMVLSVALLYVCVDILGFWYLGSQVCIMGVLAFASFLANRHVTFGALPNR